MRGSNLLLFCLGWISIALSSPSTPRNSLASPSESKETTNITSPILSIPSDFRVNRIFDSPVGFIQQACFINLIAAMTHVALGEFSGAMPVAGFRSTRFQQPVIEVNSPDDSDIPRKYVVWGLFLTAFAMDASSSYHKSFYSLTWKGREVGGIGIWGNMPGQDKQPNLPTPTPIATPSNHDLSISYAYFGGTFTFMKPTIYMTIITSLMEAAPQNTDDSIQETIINFLHNEPCALIVTPTPVARSARGPYFTNKDLIDTLAKAADYFVGKNLYRQLSFNISIDTVMVAQAAFVKKPIGGIMNLTSFDYIGLEIA
ncbi:MAG: hypothetical protein Q9170_002391 [Blastenia crenularia]